MTPSTTSRRSLLLLCTLAVLLASCRSTDMVAPIRRGLLADSASKPLMNIDGITTVGSIGSLGGGTEAFAINSHGWATGVSSVSSAAWTPHAVRFIPGQPLQDLGAPAGGRSQGYAINSNGDVAGYVQTGAASTAAVWKYGASAVRLLSGLGGQGSVAYAINDIGQVAGWATTAGGYQHAVLWQPDGTPVDLGTLGGVNSWGRAINANGDVVGYSLGGPGVILHAFLWRAGAMHDLGTLGGSESYAMALNDADEVVGYAYTSQTYSYGYSCGPGCSGTATAPVIHAFMWNVQTGMRDLDPPGTFISTDQAVAITSDGKVIGSYWLWTPSDGRETVPLGSILGANDQLQVVSGSSIVQVHWEPNQAPTAAPTAVSTHTDTPVAVPLDATDADGDVLTFAITVAPTHGTLRGTAPNLTYTPAAEFNGNDSFTFSATDPKGLSASATVSITVTPPDNTPPDITPEVIGTANANGWYTSDVTVAWNVVDDQSAITAKDGCDRATVSINTAGTTFTCTATSAGGTESKSVTIKRDATVPVVTGAVSGPAGHDGWFTGDVTVSWTASPAGPSGASPMCAPSVLTADTPGQTYTCTVTSGAGLSGSGTVSVKRDATPPAVTYLGNAGTYTVDQNITITCSAADPTPGSGLASTTCANITGPAYEFAVGVNRFSATATDVAGNVGTAQTAFTVEVTAQSLTTLITRFVPDHGVANSLIAKMQQRDYTAFRNEVSAQTGKKISQQDAALLLRLLGALP